MINVTKPFFPPKDEYLQYVDQIYNNGWVTNHGPLLNDLEYKLKNYLDIENILVVANGTIGLQIAYKALELKGEVITTPFSYVATTSSLFWEGLKPVFVDIDPQTFNIDPAQIESAITKNTSAIVATHVFGNPCDVDAIHEIASQHNLKVVYDAAHAFGVIHNNRSIYEYGDVSIASFHATKLFHTVEGGGVITTDPALHERMAYMRNFGHDGPYNFNGVGINGKNTEFHAAMGLANLKYIDQIFQRRRQITKMYDQSLQNIDVEKQSLHPQAAYNYAYYPILFPSEERLLKTFEELHRHDIYCRRYFYPLLTALEYVDHFDVPHAEDIAKRILCLPLYYDLSDYDIKRITSLIVSSQ